jgi:ParB-like chromosome segregation protein Spo0J
MRAKVLSKPELPSPRRAKSWRDVLPVHPAADLFPLLAKGELEKLARDIKENGLRQRCHIIAGEDGRPVLLDGRNRLDALEHIGTKITLDNSAIFEQLPADVDPYAFVISANIHRRHLTNEQKDELLKKLIKAKPRLSNRQIGRKVGSSHPHVAKVRRELEKSGDVETVTTSTDSLGREQPVRRHAEADAQHKRGAWRPLDRATYFMGARHPPGGRRTI